jgi:2-polyprenyl-3-methyl-5-hydroxy-6-metoxy-1,4-benzoquinol methylase
MNAVDADRHKLEEIEFHDRRERDRLSMTPDAYQAKYSNKKWYATTAKSEQFFANWIAANVPGKTVLDYCCGLGGTSLQLARAGAMVYGIDISPESVATARATLKAAGLDERSRFEVMDAENLTYSGNTFDIIVCTGVLHHLDVSKAFAELARVLKPSGTIVAIEALGYNPIIRTYRRLTPHLRTSWEADHILRLRDVRLARRCFAETEVHYFHLFSIAAAPFRRLPFFQPLLGVLNALDAIALRIPGVQLMAWQMIFFLRKPKR